MGCICAAMPIAAAISTTFLMMYWPSSVGTINFCQVSDGRNTNGPNVVIMWMKRSGMTMRSAPLTRNNIPIKHSKIPKQMRNVEKLMNGIVFSKSLCTTPLAGDRPITFSNPNQKNTINKPTRADGTKIRLKKSMIFESTISIVMFVLYFGMGNNAKACLYVLQAMETCELDTITVDQIKKPRMLLHPGLFD